MKFGPVVSAERGSSHGDEGGECSGGSFRQVANSLKAVGEIQSVDVVTRPYVLIAVTQAPDLNTMGRLV